MENDVWLMRLSLCFLVAITALLFLYDIWCVSTLEVTLNDHLPFLLPSLLTAFAVFCWRFSHEPPRAGGPPDKPF